MAEYTVMKKDKKHEEETNIMKRSPNPDFTPAKSA